MFTVQAFEEVDLCLEDVLKIMTWLSTYTTGGNHKMTLENGHERKKKICFHNMV